MASETEASVIYSLHIAIKTGFDCAKEAKWHINRYPMDRTTEILLEMVSALIHCGASPSFEHLGFNLPPSYESVTGLAATQTTE